MNGLFASSPPPPRHAGFRRSAARGIVGVIAPGYGFERVSYALPVRGYAFRTLSRLPLHRFEKTSTFWGYTPVVRDLSAPLLHTHNALPIHPAPFVVSVECEFPRYLGPRRAWQQAVGARLIASRRCAAILPKSEAALAVVRRSLAALGIPPESKTIEVFRGGLQPGAPRHDRTPGRGPLRLLFVGADGFRKGLVPLVEALESARAGGLEARLTVVSSLLAPSYALRERTPSRTAWERRLSETPWIDWRRALPNTEVRALMRGHDLLVFPTLDESHGFVPVEAAMEDLPSVTTDVFALPEMVADGITGRTIALELNRDRRWVGLFANRADQEAAIEEAYRRIRGGLLAALSEIDRDRGVLDAWGRAARAKAEALFDREAAARRLERIYDAALASR